MTTANGNGKPNDVLQSPEDLLANAQQKIREMESDYVYNALLARQEFFQHFMDPRRNLYKECGYPEPGADWNPHHYQELYDREPIAARVVQVWPKECWQVSPDVFEKAASDTKTPFEEGFTQLSKTLRGEFSWFNDVNNNLIWEFLSRVDMLSGIGRFGVILLGLDDNRPLEEPVDLTDAKEGEASRKLLYLRVFPESSVEVTQWDNDELSPRNGHPLYYNITYNNPTKDQGGTGKDLATKRVHWSRVVHVADNLEDSETSGVPRLRPVLHPVLDVRKTRGAAAECYWRGAFMGISFETNPQLGGDVRIDLSATRRQLEQYMNGFERFLIGSGMTAKTLAPQVVDPTAQILVQIESICIKLAIPKRVFMGSERGELASSQDDAAWNDRLRERQNNYITPRLIVPFIDRLIAVGVLPSPGEEGYSIEWPDLASQTDEEKARVALSMTQAISAYTTSGAEQVVPRLEFFSLVLGMPEEQALQIVESAESQVEEQDSGSSPLLGTVGGVTAVTEFFQKFKDGVIGEATLKQLLMLFYGVSEEKAEAIIADGLPEPVVPPGQVMTSDGKMKPEPPPPIPGLPRAPKAGPPKQLPAPVANHFGRGLPFPPERV